MPIRVEAKPSPRRARRGDIEGRTFTRDNPAPGLAELIALGRRAQAKGGRETPDGEFIADSKRSAIAGVNAQVSLRAMLPELLDADGRVYRAPAATPAQETRTLREALMRNSRCVAAGARLIEIVDGDTLSFGTGVPVMAEHPAEFHIIEPAEFAPIALTENAATNAVNGGTGTRDEGEVTASALPISTAALDRSALQQRAVRFTIPRSMLRSRNDRQIEAEVMMALALGLGRAVDNVLLEAIRLSERSPSEFGSWFLTQAATKGLRWSELSAILGRESVGDAQTFEQGRLYYHGVPAELSADTHAAMIGAFDRAAVAIQPEIDILVERTAAGALVLTAWADFAPLLPDPDFFWVLDFDQA